MSSEILELITKSHESIEPELLVLSVLKKFDFIDVSHITKAMAYLRFLQLPKPLLCFNRAKNGIVDDAERVKLLLVFADCHRMIGKFQKVFECYQEVEALYSALPDAVGKTNLLHASVTLMTACLYGSRFVPGSYENSQSNHPLSRPVRFSKDFLWHGT